MNYRSTLAGLMLALLSVAQMGAQSSAPVSGEPLRLTLPEAIEMGLERNPQIAMGEAAVDVAAARVMQAKANLYPSLTLSANWVHSNKLPTFETGDPSYIPTLPPNDPGVPFHYHQLPFPGFSMSNTREGDVYGLKVEAQYALFTANRIKNGIKVAELNRQTQELAVDQQKNELVYNITQAYNGIMVAQEMVRVTDDAYNTANGHYKQVRALYNEGLVSSQDLLRVETEIARIRSQQVQAKNGVEMAKIGLKNLLNLDLDTPLEVAGKLEEPKDQLPVAEDLYAQAIRNRPETRTLALREQMARTMVDVARANAYPTVGLFANYSWDRGQELPPNDTIWRDGYQAGALMTVPLFDGRATEAQVREAEANLRQVKEGERALELGVRTQVSQALLGMRAAREQIESAKVAVKSAEKNHQVVRERYAVGLSSNLEVMDAQTALLSARAQYAVALADYENARAQLDAAVGVTQREGK